MTNHPSAPADLVARCLAGDPSAWPQLVDAYGGLVHAIARAHHLDASACDDVAQTVFLALFRRLSSIRDPEQLGPWLGQTTRRECWRVARQRRTLGGEAAAAHEPAYLEDAQLERLEQRHRLLLALDELDPRCRELLRTLYGQAQEASYERVAELHQMPIGSIGPTRQRCLAKLLKLLGREDAPADRPPNPG